MARTSLTVINPKGPHPGTISANDLDFSFTSADLSNKNSFTMTGRELILARNVNSGAQTITLTSVADPQNRLGTITTYSVGASEFAMFWAGDILGWRQSDGEFYLEGSHADIKFAVVKIA